MSQIGDDQDDPLLLPKLVEDDGASGFEQQEPIILQIMELEGDPFEDANADDDVPMEIQIVTGNDQAPILGDDEVGVEEPRSESVHFREQGASLLDDRGHPEEGFDFGGDDALGIDPIVQEVDDGGLEGLDDPNADAIITDAFPPLDETEDDDEEIDVGIEISVALPPLDGGPEDD